MRILFTCSHLFGHGGIQRFNRNLMQSWSDLGFAVDAVVLGDSPDATTHSGWPAARVHCAGGSKPRWLARVARLIASSSYDQYVCGHIHLAAALVPMSMLRGVPASGRTLILHGVEIWDRLVGLRRVAAERFGQVLAVSRYTARSFLDQTSRRHPDRVVIFPNTINPQLRAHVAPGMQRLAARAPLSLLSVARLDRTERDKGILDVLAALSQLPPAVELRYVVVGDGNDRAFLEGRAAELGLADRVAFRGALSDADLWAAYEQANVFVLPSRKEGFGIVFLEAMHFGLPVVAAREKGVTDVVRDGENGFLVEAGDVGALRARLVELSSDPQLRLRLGSAGRSLVLPGGDFSFEAFTARCRDRFGDPPPAAAALGGLQA